VGRGLIRLRNPLISAENPIAVSFAGPMTPGWHRKGGRTRGFGDGTEEAISALIEVHRHLGPGLMESADEACVCAELAERGIKFGRQRALSMMYEGVRLDCGYRLDLVVRGSILLERHRPLEMV
jgi:hypothetical protein